MLRAVAVTQSNSTTEAPRQGLLKSRRVELPGVKARLEVMPGGRVSGTWGKEGKGAKKLNIGCSEREVWKEARLEVMPWGRVPGTCEGVQGGSVG